jgi:hypothetical protein
MSLEFYKTQAGRRYYDGVLPRIANALERIADVMENTTTEQTNKDNTADPVDQAMQEIYNMSSKAAVAAREKAIAAERDATGA